MDVKNTPTKLNGPKNGAVKPRTNFMYRKRKITFQKLKKLKTNN